MIHATTYTLAQIAHFNRCLFPYDLIKGLTANGLSPMQASDIAQIYIDNPRMGIVGIYQEYILYKDVTDALEKMLQSFFSRVQS